MFQEFPKSLYMGGNPEAEHVIVHNADEEAEQRERGFRMASEPVESEPVKRSPGRPRKDA
jgi:hypothetical protein